MRILIVDDDASGRELLADFLQDQLGHQVTQCDNGRKALEVFRERPFPLVLSDIRMPGFGGIKLLRSLKELPEGKRSDIVLFTGYGKMKTAIEALRAGAYDYLLKPVKVDELASLVKRIAEHQSLMELKHSFDQKVAEATRETEAKLNELRRAYTEVAGIGMIGVFSEKMRQVVLMAECLHKDRSVPVLIEGETGTGKEVIARLVHYGRGDVTAPFVSINCSAISPNLFESELFGYEEGSFTGAKKEGQIGKLELAQGGTLFLDEIGDLPLDMQPKLLRVLQDREIYRVGGVKLIELDVRIICSTNRNLARLLEEEKFRRDLFYRLNVSRINIPPLRERAVEIRPLAQMFLEQFTRQKKRLFRSISKTALKILQDHSWPGNVRELQNAIERIVLFYNDLEIMPFHLDFLSPGGGDPSSGQISSVMNESFLINFPPGGLDLKSVELEIINKVLGMFNGNKSQAARYLSINRNTIADKIRKSGKRLVGGLEEA